MYLLLHTSAAARGCHSARRQVNKWEMHLSNKQRVIHHCFGETTPVHLLSSTVFFRRRLLADSATCGSVNFIISVLVSLQPNYKLVVLSFIKIKNVTSFAQNVRHFPQYTCTMLLSTFTLRHSVLAHFIIYSSGLTALSTGSP